MCAGVSVLVCVCAGVSVLGVTETRAYGVVGADVVV